MHLYTGIRPRLTNVLNTQIAVVIALLVLVATSFYVRTFDFSGHLRWDFDRSRDMLASYNIWKYDDHSLLGHHASGFNVQAPDGSTTVMKYPPWYYYYLSFFWKVGRSVHGFLYVNAALYSLSIITVYSIGTQLSNRKAGLLAASIFALSLKYVSDSMVIIGLQVGMPVYLLSFSLFLRSIQKKSRVLNVTALSLLLSSLSFHYSVLIPFSVLFFVTEIFFNKKTLEKLSSMFIYGIYYITFFFVINSPVVAFYGLSSFLEGLFTKSDRVLLTEIPLQFYSLIYQNFQQVFFQWTTFLLSILSVSSILVLFHPRSRKRLQLVILFILLTTLVLAGAVRSEMYPNQLRVQTELSGLVLLLIFSLSLSETVQLLGSRLKAVGVGIFYGVLGLCILSSMASPANYFWEDRTYSYGHSQDLSRYILEVSSSTSFRTIVYEDNLYGKEYGLTLPLEILTGKQLARFGEYYNNGFTPLDPTLNTAVLACSYIHTSLDASSFCNQALAHYQERYPEFSRVEKAVCYSTFYIFWLRQK